MQHVVHYVDQSLAESDMNQSVARSTKVEKLSQIAQPTSVSTERSLQRLFFPVLSSAFKQLKLKGI